MGDVAISIVDRSNIPVQFYRCLLNYLFMADRSEAFALRKTGGRQNVVQYAEAYSPREHV